MDKLSIAVLGMGIGALLYLMIGFYVIEHRNFKIPQHCDMIQCR